MFRTFTILAAVAALAVSAAPAWAGTPDAAKGACAVRGFMDYTDDSCMTKAKGSGLRLADITKLATLHENEGIDGGFKAKSRLKAAPEPINPKPLSLNTAGGDDTVTPN